MALAADPDVAVTWPTAGLYVTFLWAKLAECMRTTIFLLLLLCALEPRYKGAASSPSSSFIDRTVFEPIEPSFHPGSSSTWDWVCLQVL